MLKKLTMTVLGFAILAMTTFAFADDVYVTKQGKKFHKEDCLLIKNKSPETISQKDALEKGLSPCKRCFPEEASNKNTDKEENLVKKQKKSK